jgi:hypothetical protein
MSHNNKRRQFLILISLFCITVVTHASLPVSGGRNQLINPGEIPNGLSSSDWGDIQAQVSAGMYKAYPDVNGGYISSNPAHGWQIRYSEDGTTTLLSRDHATDAYRLGFKLSAIGYSQLNPLHRPQQITAQSSTVTYQWSDTLRERWVNSKENLEQWFILDKRPTGATKEQLLTVQMTLDSDLKAALTGNAISFTTPSGSIISYNKLKVWDATGRELPANMQLAGQTLSLIVEEEHARYPLTIDPSVQKQAYLKASNTETSVAQRSDSFGISVSISGDTLVVGADAEASNAVGVNGNQNDNSILSAGAAYVFVRSDGVWKQQAYLKASNTNQLTTNYSGDGFGSSIAISGNTVVIGAPDESSNATGVNGDQNDNSASGSGAVYVFVRNGNIWSQQAYLKASNTDAFDHFGRSVSISENTLVVSAPREDSDATGVNGDENDNSATNSGAAYVFVRIGNTWSQQAYLKSSNTFGLKKVNPFGGFGTSVSVSGNTLVIGDPSESSAARDVNGDQNDNSAPGSGASYVFVRNGNTWSQQAYLKASNTAIERDLVFRNGDGFGASVSISGNTLVVGAASEDSNATGVNGNQDDNSEDNSGAAYIFIRNGSIWSQQAYLKASNTGDQDFFGYSVSISGDMLIVGGRYFDSGSGGAYVFVRNGSTWSQQNYLKGSNTERYDDFGFSVYISGDTLVVGAPSEGSKASGVNGNQNDNSVPNSGAAYVFSPNANTHSLTNDMVKQQAYLKASVTGEYVIERFTSLVVL